MKLQTATQSKLTTGFGWAVILLLMPMVLAAQERIAYVSDRSDGNAEIWSMKADGTDPRQLTFNSVTDTHPAFSPDGTRIAFISTRDGNSEIYVMRADGTDQKRLTNNPAIDYEPVWSPDGSKIAFTSFRDVGQSEIYLMNSDGTNQVNLTNAAGIDTQATFSPDGGKIAFRSGRDGNMNIYVMNADGSNQTPLTTDPAPDAEPAFSPDGSEIIFTSVRDGNNEIYVMNADGSGQTNLTNNSVDDELPSFSPDGGKITFTSERDGNSEIYMMNADGTHPTNLTNISTSDFDSSWGPANSAPVFSNVTVSSPVNEGGTATLSGTISDENEGDSFYLAVNWGDGQPAQVYEYPAGTTSFTATHVYADDNPAGTAADDYAITLTLSDHRFGLGDGSAVVTVNNVNPVLSNFVLDPSTVVVGGQVTLRGDVLDPGHVSMATDEELKVSIAWGDGASSDFTLLAPGGVVGGHQYAAPGGYAITVTATDNDLGESVQTFAVLVSPPPPPAAPTNLRVDYVAADRIQLAWTDASNNEDGFAVERCSSRGCNNFVEIARPGANATVYLDTKLFSNTQYYYRLRAYNLGGTSGYTNVVSAKTLRK